MSVDDFIDYYEVLQISPSAEPETIHRIYRLLARRHHPDNQHTGNAERFRALTDAYNILSDPPRREQYDLFYQAQHQDLPRLVSRAPDGDIECDTEQTTRIAVLEVLYANRRSRPNGPGISVLDLECLTGRTRENLEFTTWYLSQKRLVTRGDNSSLVITAEGVDYLEQSHRTQQQRRLAS